MPSERTFYRRLIKITIAGSFCLCVLLSITIAILPVDNSFKIFLIVILGVCVFLSVSGLGILIVFRKFLNDDVPRLSNLQTSDDPRGGRTRSDRIFTISRPTRGRTNQGADFDYEAPPSYEEASIGSQHSSIDFSSVTLYAACISSDEVEEEEVKDIEYSGSLQNEDTMDLETVEVLQVTPRGANHRGTGNLSDDERQEREIHTETGAETSEASAQCSVTGDTGTDNANEERLTNVDSAKEEVASPPPYPGEIEALRHLRTVQRQPGMNGDAVRKTLTFPG